jgi:hypothetical protein
LVSTVTLNAVKDTYVSLNHQSSNFVNSLGLKAGAVGFGSDKTNVYMSFIAFDLSSIPVNKVITDITLQIFLTSMSALGITISPELYQGQPLVIRGRRLNDYTIDELSTLTYTSLQGKTGIDNPYATSSDLLDSSINLSYYSNSYISLKIKDISKDSKCIVAFFRDEDYQNNITYNFASMEHGASYTPKLLVTYDDYVPPKPTNLSPNLTTKNKAGITKLSWVFEDSYMGTLQASYELAYSTNNFSSSTTVTGATNNYHNLAADIFTNGQTVKWKVRITDTNGDTSLWSDIASFLIGATVPSAPELLNPVNTIVNSADQIYFRWKFKDLYGYNQSKYDLQYKKAGEAETTITVTSQTTEYIMPVNTLLGGDYLWRVRCYNPFNEVSAYSEWLSFYSIGQPNAPIINSVSNSMHPLIKWTAVEQDLYVIKIYKGTTTVYDSGEQPSASTNEYIVEDFLDNGTYTAGVKTSNVYGFWSAETLSAFTINTVKPSKPSILGNVNGLYIALIIASSTVDNIIYRKSQREDEFKLLAMLDDNAFIDYTAPAGDVQYYVRSITADGYMDSDIITMHMSFLGVVLSGLENQTDYINLYNTKDFDKRKNISSSKSQYLVNLNGRTYPVQQSMPFKNHAENHEYFIHEEDFDKLYRIINYNTLVYRNSYGYSFVVSISNPIIQEDIFGFIIAFTLTRLEE